MAILLAEQSNAPSKEQDELVRFLEQNPEYYSIMKSNLFIKILKSLSTKAKNILMLKRDFPRMERGDLLLLMETLAKVKAIANLDTNSGRFYYASEKGKRFLAVYREAKEKFLGKEEGL